MPGEAFQFAGSLLAVVALVALTWLLGFRQQPQLASADEARALIRLAPGGFEPEALALDEQARAAIGRDAAGRVMVLAPHGSRFVALLVSDDNAITRSGGELLVRAEDRHLKITLGAAAADWITADSDVS